MLFLLSVFTIPAVLPTRTHARARAHRRFWQNRQQAAMATFTLPPSLGSSQGRWRTDVATASSFSERGVALRRKLPSWSPRGHLLPNPKQCYQVPIKSPSVSPFPRTMRPRSSLGAATLRFHRYSKKRHVSFCSLLRSAAATVFPRISPAVVLH